MLISSTGLSVALEVGVPHRRGEKMRSEGGQQQRREDRNLLFEQGEECPAPSGIRAGEEDRASARKNTGIKLAEVCWEDWVGAEPGPEKARVLQDVQKDALCQPLAASGGYLRVA